jgi:hypothetical protein
LLQSWSILTFYKKKRAQDLESRARNFAAIINTNHQRKNFHSKAEIFLYNRRDHFKYVTSILFFN